VTPRCLDCMLVSLRARLVGHRRRRLTATTNGRICGTGGDDWREILTMTPPRCQNGHILMRCGV